MILTRKLWLSVGLLLFGVVVALALPAGVHAEGLQIRPLLYTQKLQPGESKRGYVDVSNATHSAVDVSMDVQSFRQTDGRGTLQFFASDTTSAAVRLDLSEISLGPSEAIRVYFQIDPAKLPTGDNFAAIFATTRTVTQGGTAPSARVGTLLLLENGSGGPHRAAVTELNAPLLNFGGTLQATAAVRNTGDPKTTNAFFPQLGVSVGPWPRSAAEVRGPLVFSGITRSVPVAVKTENMIGLYRLTVSADSGSSSRWLLLVTGIWRWIIGLIILLVIGFIVWMRRNQLELRWIASRGTRRRPDKPVHAPQDKPIDTLPSGLILPGSDTAQGPTDPVPANGSSVRETPQNNPQLTPLSDDDKNTTKTIKKTTKKHRKKRPVSTSKKAAKNSKKH